ncbi:Hypothetical predicted protein [Octopus vulgaris]|uniref:Uncharacterized protein n=1 Tax=Octopus vulgaris TaxID=6645 RepID=A0AA36FES5_OCTVU|nr:Hypothetical predicted protein [Octopus vulgaris]
MNSLAKSQEKKMSQIFKIESSRATNVTISNNSRLPDAIVSYSCRRLQNVKMDSQTSKAATEDLNKNVKTNVQSSNPGTGETDSAQSAVQYVSPMDRSEVKKLLSYSTNFARYFQFSEEDQKKLTFSSYFDKDYKDEEKKRKDLSEFPNYTRIFTVKPGWDQMMHRDDRKTTEIVRGRFCEEERRRGVPLASSSFYGRHVIGPLESHSRVHAKRVLITGPGGNV